MSSFVERISHNKRDCSSVSSFYSTELNGESNSKNTDRREKRDTNRSYKIICNLYNFFDLSTSAKVLITKFLFH